MARSGRFESMAQSARTNTMTGKQKQVLTWPIWSRWNLVSGGKSSFQPFAITTTQAGTLVDTNMDDNSKVPSDQVWFIFGYKLVIGSNSGTPVTAAQIAALTTFISECVWSHEVNKDEKFEIKLSYVLGAAYQLQAADVVGSTALNSMFHGRFALDDNPIVLGAQQSFSHDVENPVQATVPAELDGLYIDFMGDRELELYR